MLVKKIFKILCLFSILFFRCSLFENPDLSVEFNWNQRTAYLNPGGWLYGGVDIDYIFENTGNVDLSYYEVVFEVIFDGGIKESDKVIGYNLAQGDKNSGTLLIYSPNKIAKSVYVKDKSFSK